MACVSIRIRRDTKANWEKVNPVLKEGEMSFCTDKFMIKFGDGKTKWKDLTCVIDINALQTTIEKYDLNIKQLTELVEYVESTTNTQLQQVQDAIAAVNGIIADKIGINDVESSASTTYSSAYLERVFERLKKDSGYLKIVDTIEERDAILESDRRIGMLVVVTDDEDSNNNKTYQLIGTIDNTGWEIFSSGSGGGGGNVPELSYTSDFPQGKKIYYSVGDNAIIFVRFTSTTYGDCTLRVYKDNVLLKTITSPKGTIAIDLGTLTTEGTSTYRISGADYLGIAAPEDLLFTVVCGGLTLTSTFGSIINNTVFEETTAINVPYSVKCSDTSQIVKILCRIMKDDGTSSQEIINTGSYAKTGTWYVGLKKRGTYTITLQAYTGTSIDDASGNTLVSSALSYSINVLSNGEISIVSELDPNGINTNMYLSIPYRVSGKNTSLLLMKGILYKVSNYGASNEALTEYTKTPDAGVQSTVGVTSYWFVGKLAAGTYKYSMKSYTLDSQKSSVDTAEGYFTVEAASYDGVTPVMENLIAWFDANDMRNNVENPDQWNNKVSEYSQYQIKLHDLNYNTNGWKHVDESLSDSESGEMMLKFTGNSYGEMINKNTGERYCPLAGFNDGTEGYSLELVFRTRCVGEMKARVITCQKGIDTNTAGFSVTHEDLYIGSSSQNTNLGFAEDEWVHATFVIDRNIRSLEKVGLTNIENMNPIPTMRIYINGVLCSVTALTNDKFLDSLGNAYPLMLNASLVQNIPSYFGECEIKMIRLYNHYLDSSQVLQNYISSIYDLTEQNALKEKNDITTNKLPIITFKRKKIENNSNFEVLNSITDKATSNKTYVECVVEIQNTDGTMTVWENVSVFLQGTSSLQYPVKNYKLKLYADEAHTSKLKVKMKDDWEKENTFTLKCDYMESSHLNNTPTAKFYNDLITILGGQSPAKANGYKDAIDGFPVIVYYTDDEQDTSKLTLVGSYMFNIDKKGKTLGFDAKVVDENGQSFTDEEGNPIDNKCQSYEGTANASDTAGCFYKLSESIKNVYNYYVEDCYEEAYMAYLKSHGLSANSFSMDDFKATPEGKAVTYKTFDEFKESYSEYDYVSSDFEARYDYTGLEDKENPTEHDLELGYGALRDMINGVSDAVNNNNFKAYFEEHFDFIYAAAYYLQMIVFGQVDNAGKNSMWDTWDGKKWYVRPYDMDTQAGLANTGTESIGVDAEMIPALSPTVATGTFADYSTNSLTELRYASYNTKTSKFWNTFAKEYSEELKKLYQNLRKSVYDVDYIMKYYKTHTTDLIGEIFYNKDMAAKYLTQTSATNTEYLKMLHGNRLQRFKQWISQRLDFCDTIFDYRYSEDNTNSINGEISLRTDAYLLTGNTEESKDEASTLKAYIGILTYTPQYVTISVGSGRDAIITAYVSQNSTYIDPDTKREVQGTLFTFPVKATDKEITISAAGGIQLLNKLEDLNIRDLTIANATKILKLDLSGSSRMSRLILGNNKYLRELNCSGSVQLGTANGGQVLDLTGCKNIQKLDITNTKIVTINFAEGSNLQTAILSKSSIKNLYFKSLEFLTEVNIDGCNSITEYIIDSCSAIKNVSLSGSPVVIFNAINCKNLQSVDVSNCKVLETFELTNCPNIYQLLMSNNNGSMMNDLHLYTLYKLKKLDVSNSTSLKNIRLPKYISQDEANRVAALKANNPNLTDEECNAQLWNVLETLNIRSSSIISIQYGSAEIAESDRKCDMKQLSKLSSISFQNCTSIKAIENINYVTSNMDALFDGCNSLQRVTGYLKCTSLARYLFRYCYVLTDINNLTFDFAGVTDISYLFYVNGGNGGTPTYSMARKVLYACDESLKNINDLMWGCKTEQTIPSDLFAHTPNITTASCAFINNKLTKIPKALFDNLTKLQNASYMFYVCRDLVSIDQNVFEKAVSLVDVSRMFGECTNLVNFIHSNCNIFANTPNITSTYAMFHNCIKLINTNGLSGMLDPLVNLKNASYMFYGCAALTGNIPNGFFAKNVLLTTANGVFAGCSKITGLPSRLFRVNDSDKNELPYLTSAKSMFYECTSLTGDVQSNFFAGASNLKQIGQAITDNLPMSSYRYTLYGFFGNTKIEGYFEDFLATLPNLLDASYLFYHSSGTNNEALKYCYYRENGVEKEYTNSLSINMFNGNPLLQNVSNAFRYCKGLKGCIPYKEVNGKIISIFEPCKNNIIDASYMFDNCTLLSGTDLDNSVMVGIKKELFKDCIKLQTVKQFFGSNSNHSFTIPTGLFDGCISLKDTSYLFYNCALLQGSIPVSLFNSCRETLEDVSYMFWGCLELSGELPTGSKDESGNITQKGFLADCLKLKSASYLFYDCEGLTGGIPDDIFYTSSITDKYTELKDISGMFRKCRGLNAAYHDESLDVDYICASDMFAKCVALTTIAAIFRECFKLPACSIPQNLFAKQTALQYANEAFYGIDNLTGAITNTFMINCINTLVNAYGMFAFTNISSVSSGFLHGELKNTKLKYIGALFYRCSNISGTVPFFWDGNTFSAIVSDTTGYFGALYNCSKLSNYAAANAVSTNWTKNLDIYAR